MVDIILEYRLSSQYNTHCAWLYIKYHTKLTYFDLNALTVTHSSSKLITDLAISTTAEQITDLFSPSLNILWTVGDEVCSCINFLPNVCIMALCIMVVLLLYVFYIHYPTYRCAMFLLHKHFTLVPPVTL